MTRSLLSASSRTSTTAGSGWKPVSLSGRPCSWSANTSLRTKSGNCPEPCPMWHTSYGAQKPQLEQTLPLLQIDYREYACRVALSNCMSLYHHCRCLHEDVSWMRPTRTRLGQLPKAIKIMVLRGWLPRPSCHGRRADMHVANESWPG